METITSIRFNKAATKESHAVWFHLYKAQKVAKLIMVLEVKLVVTLMGVVTETVGEGLLRVSNTVSSSGAGYMGLLALWNFNAVSL